jgi:hypothetical protein
MANSGGVGCDVGDRRALRLLGPDSFLSAPNSVSLPRDTAGARKLCQVYLQNVDPIMKILHRPTLTRWMMYDSSPNPNPNKSVRALEFAVCYAAAMTMTDAQCQEAFQKSKANVSTVYRKLCEDAIEMAGLVTTRDMTVLQAFVLYLVSTTPTSPRPIKGETLAVSDFPFFLPYCSLAGGPKTKAPPSGPSWRSPSGSPAP